jgi:peptidoglycan/LPS O-acetylase OafA/YrhL
MLAFKYFVFEKFGPFGNTLGNSMSLNLGCFFVSGALLASIQLEKYKFKFPLLVSTFILLIISIYLNLFFYFQYLFLPVIVVLTGISSTNYFLSLTNRIGDFSYGIYIYSFPIQVTLMYYLNLNYLQLMWLSLMLSVLFGVLSWNLIEKKALQYKSYQLKPLFRVKRKLHTS